MVVVYQNSIVAFIDLLGFKNAVQVEENAAELLRILQQIKKQENPECRVDIDTSETITTIKIKPIISASSDNVVISVPEKQFNNAVSWRHAVIEILNIVQQLANFLIQKGFLLRGGITVGKIYHESNIILGPAHVCAYELESKKAIYPRILASQELIDIFNADKNGGTHKCFIMDKDNQYHLDYLPTALNFAQIDCYNQIIQKQILSLEKVVDSDPQARKILEKWRWFEEYYQLTIKKICP